MEVGNDKMKAITIRDSASEPFTEWIMSKIKTIETRKINAFKSIIGEEVALIRTGNGKPCVVGYIIFGEPKVYNSIEDFEKDEELHKVKRGSSFFIEDGKKKYGYPILSVRKLEHPELVYFRGCSSIKNKWGKVEACS